MTRGSARSYDPVPPRSFGDGTGVSAHHQSYLRHRLKALNRASPKNKLVLDNIFNITQKVNLYPLPKEAETGFRELKNTAGIYLLFRDENLLYVGYSSGLRYRLTRHCKEWMSPDPDYFPTHAEVVGCRNLDFAAQMESDLIDMLHPPLNRTNKKWQGITDEHRERQDISFSAEDIFPEYGILECDTNKFFGWFRCFEDVFDQWLAVTKEGSGSWRMVTPKDYSF